MKINPYIRKPWSISREDERIFSSEKIKESLKLLNRVSNENFFMVDYLAQRILSGVLVSSSLCGYPNEVVQREGLGIYNLILSKSEQNWLKQMNKAAFDVFFEYSEQERKELVFSYHLNAKTINQDSVILFHRLVPYKLCKNGNMWLGLCLVSMLPALTEEYKASITNYLTGKKHNFIDSKFVECHTKALTAEEISILELMAKDMQGKQIEDILKVSDSYLKRKKQIICDKLGVNTSVGAACKAKDLGII